MWIFRDLKCNLEINSSLLSWASTVLTMGPLLGLLSTLDTSSGRTSFPDTVGKECTEQSNSFGSNDSYYYCSRF